MPDVNLLAVLVASQATFAVGALWYSPLLFGRLWAREAGMLDAFEQKPGEPRKGKHPARVFGLALLFSFAATYVLAVFLGPHPPLDRAVLHGFLAGVGFVAASFGINYQFANRTTLLWAIDGGYHVVQFTLFGLVLGLFG